MRKCSTSAESISSFLNLHFSFIISHFSFKNLAVIQIFITFAPAKSTIVQWCNGSTTGFGSVCGGSNPPWTTKRPDNIHVVGSFCHIVIAIDDAGIRLPVVYRPVYPFSPPYDLAATCKASSVVKRS